MTDEQRWLSRKYVAYRTLASAWFVGAVWLYFYRIFITDQQVGLLAGEYVDWSMVGMILEVLHSVHSDR